MITGRILLGSDRPPSWGWAEAEEGLVLRMGLCSRPRDCNATQRRSCASDDTLSGANRRRADAGFVRGLRGVKGE